MIDTSIRKTLGPTIRMVLPIALQMLMQTLLNIVDTAMVGRLGEVEIGAIALGNQVYFLVVLSLFGVGGGAAVFASQYWGNRDAGGVRRSPGVSLVFGLVGSGTVALAAVFFPRALLSVFTTDRAVGVLLAFAIAVPPPFTYGAFFVEETLRCAVGIGRIRSGTWMHVITDSSLHR